MADTQPATDRAGLCRVAGVPAPTPEQRRVIELVFEHDGDNGAPFVVGRVLRAHLRDEAEDSPARIQEAIDSCVPTWLDRIQHGLPKDRYVLKLDGLLASGSGAVATRVISATFGVFLDLVRRPGSPPFTWRDLCAADPSIDPILDLRIGRRAIHLAGLWDNGSAPWASEPFFTIPFDIEAVLDCGDVAGLAALRRNEAAARRGGTSHHDSPTPASPRQVTAPPKERSVPKPAKIFISYSHEDEAHRKTLDKSLSVLKRQGIVSVWHDRQIQAGDEWKGAIDRNLEEADIILLLLSMDFLASDYCWDVEMTRAMERHDAGSARVIPIFVRACDWHGAPFTKLQGVPDPKVPIEDAPSKDGAWTAVAKAIREVVDPR